MIVNVGDYQQRSLCDNLWNYKTLYFLSAAERFSVKVSEFGAQRSVSVFLVSLWSRDWNNSDVPADLVPEGSMERSLIFVSLQTFKETLKLQVPAWVFVRRLVCVLGEKVKVAVVERAVHLGEETDVNLCFFLFLLLFSPPPRSYLSCCCFLSCSVSAWTIRASFCISIQNLKPWIWSANKHLSFTKSEFSDCFLIVWASQG